MTFSWLVLVLTNSAFYLGLVGALQTLPVLLFSLLGARWRTTPVNCA